MTNYFVQKECRERLGYHFQPCLKGIQVKIIFRSVFQVKEVLVKSNLYSNMEDALKAEVKKQNKFSIGQ